MKPISQESPEQPPAEKTIRRIPYTGVWIKGKGGNQPILCIHPEFLNEMAPLLEQLNGQIIKASIQIEEKPLITRLNLRGIRDSITALLQQALSKNHP